MDELFKKYIFELVDKFFPKIRKRKYTNEYIFDMFLNILKDCNSWKSLKLLAKYNDSRKSHYKYLNQIFNKWSNADIFKLAYERILKEYYFKKIIKSNIINLFIDSSYIFNKYGITSIAINPEYKKKKVSKISIISDEKGTILASTYDKTHKNKNNKYSFSHDLTLVQPTLDNLHIKIPKNITTKLGGDKGYISSRKFKLNNGRRINIIAPKRKNQIQKNTKQEIEYLKKRGSVERAISSIKKYSRISSRKDKKIENFMGFLYLSFILLFLIKLI